MHSRPRRLSLLLVATSTLPLVVAQSTDDSDTHIAGTQTSKFAITGAIIGGVLLLISFIAVGIYGIDRWLSRRRQARGRFAPLPTLEVSEPYRYLATVPYLHPPPRRGNHPPAKPTNPSLSTDGVSPSYTPISPSPSLTPTPRRDSFDPYAIVYANAPTVIPPPLPSPAASFQSASSTRSGPSRR
ncbi:hypothetical protein C8F01DRAFT_1150442 [Mycena amicta]|nr:hypothetical protein C8F01DRAFT_1150442 [Mycena amicta]